MAPSFIRQCCQVLRWLPVVFIAAVVVWSYYAYVVQMCIFTVDSVLEKVLYLLFYHPLLILFNWSYIQTIFTPNGKVPKNFYLSQQEVEALDAELREDNQRALLTHYAKNLPIQCKTISGAPRYCEKCKCIKPDRCHHCSVCSVCVLKMDHHCPWVNNCVGFSNYKFFILFLGYSLLYCLYIAATSLQYFIEFWTVNSNTPTAGRFHILFLFFVSVMFGCSLISLFCYHIFLILRNRTTLEAFRAPIFQTGPDKDGFNIGKMNNFIQVFGDNKYKVALPIYTSCGDGVSYRSRTSTGSCYQTMGTSAGLCLPSHLRESECTLVIEPNNGDYYDDDPRPLTS
ncbi:palmitoyltransferase ZDHHC2 isoform X1 [Octopus sinensis]|uniref:Palmitoyltransferase n=1 Tax=Octopus sinensis TaxID=2607531 RepID=A0A6P7TGX1_9MOLL|nr:palmitoyltransferase ZDHHC2 isoform X1 [Octopus sinensis]